VLMNYRTTTGRSWSNDIQIALSGTNVFDRNPPAVNNQWGYDVANVQPLGRLLALSVKKNW